MVARNKRLLHSKLMYILLCSWPLTFMSWAIMGGRASGTCPGGCGALLPSDAVPCQVLHYEHHESTVSTSDVPLLKTRS